MNKLIFRFLVLLIGCSTLNATELVDIEKDDFHVILSSLLGVNKDRHSYTDGRSKSHANELMLFKELEEIYIQYIEPQDNGVYTEKQLKIIMLFSFYAVNKNSGAFNEYLATDLMPIFLDNQSTFLAHMRELPFLIPSVCDRLSAYFGFENKDQFGKEVFIEKIKFQMHAILTDKQARSCLIEFE